MCSPSTLLKIPMLLYFNNFPATMKISVIGTGYVGLSLAVLLSKKFEVIAVDIVDEKIKLINNKKSPISDEDIENYLSEGQLNLIATTDINRIVGSDFIIIATPTNYDTVTKQFDTSSVESVLSTIKTISPESTIIIKSTIPIGYTLNQYKKNKVKLLFSPEFLREGKALHDNLYPSRIVVGIPDNKLLKEAETFSQLLNECAIKPTEVYLMGSTEAESVKLFANTYLAMRVAFFNELDSFSIKNNLNTKEIITGVCADPRIGNHYNNPSFGYGGYCLPKDTKQLLSNYANVPNSLIEAIITSNQLRKQLIVDEIKKIMKNKKKVGVYRLIMKFGSDNFRESSTIDILKMLNQDGYEIVIYEPTILDKYYDYPVISDLDEFANICDIIIANRNSNELTKYKDKVFCRDLFNMD